VLGASFASLSLPLRIKDREQEVPVMQGVVFHLPSSGLRYLDRKYDIHYRKARIPARRIYQRFDRQRKATHSRWIKLLLLDPHPILKDLFPSLLK